MLGHCSARLSAFKRLSRRRMLPIQRCIPNRHFSTLDNQFVHKQGKLSSNCIRLVVRSVQLSILLIATEEKGTEWAYFACSVTPSNEPLSFYIYSHVDIDRPINQFSVFSSALGRPNLTEESNDVARSFPYLRGPVKFVLREYDFGIVLFFPSLLAKRTKSQIELFRTNSQCSCSYIEPQIYANWCRTGRDNVACNQCILESRPDWLALKTLVACPWPNLAMLGWIKLPREANEWLFANIISMRGEY